MSAEATSYSGLEGIVVTCGDPQGAASSDAVDGSTSKGSTECSTVMRKRNRNDVTVAETSEFEDNLPIFIKKFKAWMHRNQLSQRVVAPVLNLSQSHLCDLLNAKKQGNSWSNIATAGRRPYHRMKKVMEDGMILKALCHNRDSLRKHSKTKKKIGRPYNPNRLILNIHQKKVLEDAYTLAKYPTAMEYNKIAITLGITPRQVKTWFNNRRKVRCCPPSLQDENSYIEPMPESVSRGLLVEEFRVENGDVVAMEPYMATEKEETISLPKEGSFNTHDAMGEDHNKRPIAGETLTSYLKALEERKEQLSEANESNENNTEIATSNVMIVDVDSQEPKTHSEVKQSQPEVKTDELVEVVRTGHIEVKDGVVLITSPIPSLGVTAAAPAKERACGVRTNDTSSLPFNSHGNFGENFVTIDETKAGIPAALVKQCGSEGKMRNEILGDESVIEAGQQSPASHDSVELESPKISDMQLKFLQLSLEMHGNPSEEILNALSVLICLEKEQIREWFKNSLKGKTL